MITGWEFLNVYNNMYIEYKIHKSQCGWSELTGQASRCRANAIRSEDWAANDRCWAFSDVDSRRPLRCRSHCAWSGRPGLSHHAMNYCKYIRRPNCRQVTLELSAQFVDAQRSRDEGINLLRWAEALRFCVSIYLLFECKCFKSHWHYC